jgi:hypothetical protein
VKFVDWRIVREEFAFGKEESGHGLARDVHETLHPEADGRLENVERRHQVGAEHHLRRVAGWLGNSGTMHHSVGPADDGERFAGIGEIGHLVPSRSLWLSFESRPGQIGREHLVTRVKQCLGRSATDLAVGTRNDYLHDCSLFTRDMANGRPAVRHRSIT